MNKKIYGEWYENLVAFKVTVFGYSQGQERRTSFVFLLPDSVDRWMQEVEDIALEYLSHWESVWVESIEKVGYGIARWDDIKGLFELASEEESE